MRTGLVAVHFLQGQDVGVQPADGIGETSRST